MKLNALFLALCFIIGVLSAAIGPEVGAGLAHDAALVDSKLVRRGCWAPTAQDSGVDVNGPPPNIDQPGPTTPDHIFGRTDMRDKCPKLQHKYGCERGYCWQACGVWADWDWCWTAHHEGMGPWVNCNNPEDCKPGNFQDAKCCQCSMSPRCGCGCGSL